VAITASFWLVSVSHFFYNATGVLLAGIPFFIKYTLASQMVKRHLPLRACVRLGHLNPSTLVPGSSTGWGDSRSGASRITLSSLPGRMCLART
jgi:hypothetical protein